MVDETAENERGNEGEPTNATGAPPLVTFACSVQAFGASSGGRA